MEDVDLHFSVSYRGKSLQLTLPADSTVGELGQKLVELTGVAPHTIKLMLPKRPPLQPMSAQYSSTLLYQSGISEGLTVRMMGSSAAEVATVSQGSAMDSRVRGFAEEEELARRRASFASSSKLLPKSNYIFCDFRTLTLPGIELIPPPSVALDIMHKLASDRGIVAIMNKYRWRVGVMTEMAPVGYVGISPKCILGFNKNRGEEISLRLRTDDLNGFRKYESIKKTLLHELAHMVHDEHDEKFHALDKKLNEEAVALDWTKAQGHTLSGARFGDTEVDAGGVQTPRGHRLGGSRNEAQYMDPRAAAAAAALRRFAANSSTSSAMEQTSSASSAIKSNFQPVRHAEPDPDDLAGEFMAVIAEGNMFKRESEPEDTTGVVPNHRRRTEPERVEIVDVPQNRAEPDPDDVEMVPRGDEPDPDDDDELMAKGAEPDHEKKFVRLAEPDPDGDDEVMAKGAEPDPDYDDELMAQGAEPDHEKKLVRLAEPDPDGDNEIMARAAEPDPDDDNERMRKGAEPDHEKKSVRLAEPDPDGDDEIMAKGAEPDPDDHSKKLVGAAEPDPDDVKEKLVGAFEPKRDEHTRKVTRAAEPYPDDDDEMMAKGAGLDSDEQSESLIRAGEPDPDDQREKSPSFGEPDPDDSGRTCKKEAKGMCSPTVAREYRHQCSF